MMDKGHWNAKAHPVLLTEDIIEEMTAINLFFSFFLIG
jgi:hypothetical protein